MNSFTNDIKKMSIDDIELILEDQLDMYNKDEINLLKEELKRRKELEEAQSLNRVIRCIKCDGENLLSDEACKYCGYKINKNRYKSDNEEDKEEKEVANSNRSLYIISFLIPIVGIILGIVYIGKDEEDLGKSLIIFSIFIIIIYSATIRFVIFR